MMAGPTLPEFYRNVYLPTQLVGCAETTVSQYSTAISHYIASGDGVQLADLTEEHLAAVVRHILGRGSSPATAAKVLRHLMAIIRFARRRRLIKRVPRLRPLKIPEHLPEAWRLDEVAAILKATREECGQIAGLLAADWWEAIVLCCYDSGGRIGAVLAMAPEDMDRARGWAVFRAENQKQKRDRFFQVAPETIAAVTRIWDSERPLVFPWPYRRETLYCRFRKILKRAGVVFGQTRGGLFHKLRRTSGSLVEAAGGDGSRHIGNTRSVFVKHYLDPRVAPHSQFSLLPRPKVG